MKKCISPLHISQCDFDFTIEFNCKTNTCSLHRCRFSQMLHPIFEEASNIVREEFPSTNQVVFARVDCDQHCECCCFYWCWHRQHQQFISKNIILLQPFYFFYTKPLPLLPSFHLYITSVTLLWYHDVSSEPHRATSQQLLISGWQKKWEVLTVLAINWSRFRWTEQVWQPNWPYCESQTA